MRARGRAKESTNETSAKKIFYIDFFNISRIKKTTSIQDCRLFYCERESVEILCKSDKNLASTSKCPLTQTYTLNLNY